ncbi:MAG: plasmid pRiA4b ORF-3 family protein [Anaerolineae bacterium]|nr:plasmid pRiA4b ORF-3 family protein [Anaerolineae bacterium]
MPAKPSATLQQVYQLKVTLRGSKPPIWRRVQVADSTSLAKLHQIIQIALGWTNSHMHQFEIGNRFYSDPMFQLDDVINEQRTTLNKLALEPKAHFHYEYDFGDSWDHDILVEKVLPPESDIHYPRCIAGKRAGPPDDCGGIWGYYGLLEAVQDPNHPQHEDMLEWLGGPLDPDAFDLEAINAQLRTIK